jgi:protein-disulfide isomerase/uncharacterized membrane protein
MKSIRSASAQVDLASIVLAAAGLFVALTLSLAHAQDRVVPCGGGSGCGAVAADPSSFIFGIPFAYFGVLAYVALLASSIGRATSPRTKLFDAAATFISGVGTVVSVWLTAHSVFGLHAVCIWCIASAIIMTLSLVFALLAKRFEHPSVGGRFAATTAACLLLLVLGGLAVSMRSLEPPSPSIALNNARLEVLAPPNAPVRGDRVAPVTVVEFADFNCPACKEMHRRLKNLIGHHPKNIRLIFRHLPLSSLSGHETSAAAAEMGIQAGSMGKFWEFADLVYTKEEPVSLRTLNSLFHQATGSDYRKSNTDAIGLRADLELAKKLGFIQTPSYVVFLNDRYVGTANSLTLQKLLETPDVLKAITSASAN